MGFSDILNNADTESKTQGGAVSPSDPLPADFLEIILSLIDDYSQKFKIDDMQKAAAIQWRSCCTYIGMWAKQNKFYVDKEKSARQGGKIYDVEKIAAAVDVWAFLCGNFKKVPLVADFIEFVGVSRSWFYDCNGHCDLTSAGGLILKKVNEIQTTGLASGIVDGRENPTGKIYFSKAVLGWSEDGRRRDDLQGQNENLQSFPDLAGLLPQKKE